MGSSLQRGKAVLALIGTTCIIACGGAASELGVGKSAEEAMSADGQTVLAQVRFVNGEFDEKSSSLECLKLRTELFAQRQAFKLGTEWRTITDTVEYTTLQKDEENFKGAGCADPESRTSSDACKDLASKLDDDADKLHKTAAWQLIVNNQSWKDLLTKYSEAQDKGCLTAPR